MTGPGDLAAGHAALAAADWPAARSAFERLLADGEIPEALEGLGRALWWQDLAQESFDARERAYRLYAQAGDARGAARTAACIAIDIFDYHGGAVMNGWLQRARRHLDGVPPSPEHGWLALWEGHYARMVDGDLATAERKAADVIEVGRAFGMADLELLGIALDGARLVSAGRVDEGMQRLDEATTAAIAGEITDLDAAAVACCFMMHACEQVRDLDRATQWVERVEAFSRRWRIRPLFAVCRVHHASLQIARGDWSTAEEALERVARELGDVPGPARSEALLHLGDLRRRQGRWDEADRLFEEVEAYSLALLARATMALDEGDARTAAYLLERGLRRAAPDNWTVRATALGRLARAHAELGERDAAASRLDELRQMARTVGTDYLRATLRQAEGDTAATFAEARPALEDAVDLFERCRAPYEAARARMTLAQRLHDEGHPAPARREGEAARATFVRLGAARDAARADEHLTPPAEGPPPAAGAPRLTPREREVLALVAEGLADKEIAARLALSEHTVHRHVANVLVRLGVPSRTAAVALAMRQRLL